MEAVSWSEVQYKQAAALPKLRITEEISRRDSITSSKTGDSGYNSDPDISLSPLDFARPDKLLLFPDASAPQPPLPTVILDLSIIDVDEASSSIWNRRLPKGSHGSTLLKRQRAASPQRPKVTSVPHSCPQTTNRPNWTNAFKGSLEVPHLNHLNEAPPKINLSRKDKVEIWIDESVPSHNRPKERVSSIVSLSSTGSGGDYSITDDSEMEEAHAESATKLSRATLTTIELILRKVEVNLGYVAYIQCAGGQSAKGNGCGELSRGRRGSAQHSVGKRKPRGDEGSPPEDEDDDGPTKRRRVSITTTEDSENGPRFACPFYKHDPNRYRNRRTCPGPGWPTVHRMKEHLYRSHTQPIFCPRCYTMFDADSDLANHLRSDPCQMSAPQPVEGIDRETLKDMRKRSPPLRLEEDKWRDTYQLLFPEVTDADIPSPYYDSDSPTDESRRFRRELLQRIRRELFATAEQENGAVEQNLLRQVAGIIQRCENDLLASFYAGSSTVEQVQRNQQLEIRARTPHFDPARLPFSLRSLRLPMAPNSAPPTSSFPPAEPHRFDDPQGQIPALAWDDPFGLIDWNAVFPPVPEVQVPERGEALPSVSTPVWT